MSRKNLTDITSEQAFMARYKSKKKPGFWLACVQIGDDFMTPEWDTFAAAKSCMESLKGYCVARDGVIVMWNVTP